MLTGMLEPTSGSSHVLGFNTWTQWSQVQKLLGLCPQSNILYPTLSALEHLTLYGKVKGVLNDFELEMEVKSFIKAMEMTECAQNPTQELSEGMKRRLCVALAFIGGSKVVILDEPTSGVDPFARRHIWDLISHFKPGRTIIFTTHHLDEAELLADKIAILHQGSVLAQGSVSDLKRQFRGSGFELTVNPKTNLTDLQETLLPHIQNTVPNAKRLPKRHKKDSSLRLLLPMFNRGSQDSQKEGEWLPFNKCCIQKAQFLPVTLDLA